MGVLPCGAVAGRYCVVHYVDAIDTATRSFPAIRASLNALQPRQVKHDSMPDIQSFRFQHSARAC